MQDSHTPVVADETTDPDRLRLVGTATLGLPERLAGRLDGHLAQFVEHMREGLLAASTAVGLDVMAELMETEVTDLAGPKGKHDPARVAKRHGSQDGTVTLGGRRVPVRRPRVRTVGDDEHELTLASYAMFVSADLLADGVVARMLGGLSTRGYPVGLEPVGAQVEQAAMGTSRSAVSRRFVTATAERLDQLLHRPLGGQRWLVVFLDGFGMGEHLLVGALGVTADGTKVPLGVVEGTTENKAVCLRLVTGLRDRGLDADHGGLFVLDGGKALGAAVRAVFGANALVQRCRRHKERNGTDHLPEAERPLMQRRLRSAWANPDPDHAQHELEALARGLTRQRPGAAASLREGLAETLTVNRLGVGGKLLQTLESTNPVESMIEIVRDHAGRVKRWSRVRWRCAGRRPGCSPPKPSSAGSRATRSSPNSPPRSNAPPPTSLAHSTSLSPPDRRIRHEGPTQIQRRAGHPPMRLGERLTQAKPGRELTQVRVYRGQPDSTKDPKSYGANRRQQAAWERAGATVIQRSLRYPNNWPDERAEEKGIDVALAVDFVMMAVTREYDVGIIMSTDTDLRPAIEAVASLEGGPVCEVAVWKEPGRHARQLYVPGVDLWCHYLYLEDYKPLTDGRDYTIGT